MPDRGNLVSKRKKIFSHYLKGFLLLDVSLFILFVASNYSDNKLLNLLLLLRIAKIIQIISNLERLIDIRESFQTVYDLVKLLFLILFIAHFCGCLFFYVSYRQYQKGQAGGWVEEKGLIGKPSDERVRVGIRWTLFRRCVSRRRAWAGQGGGRNKKMPLLQMQSLTLILLQRTWMPLAPLRACLARLNGSQHANKSK